MRGGSKNGVRDSLSLEAPPQGGAASPAGGDIQRTRSAHGRAPPAHLHDPRHRLCKQCDGTDSPYLRGFNSDMEAKESVPESHELKLSGTVNWMESGDY